MSILIDLIVWILSPIVTLHPTITYFRIANATAHRYFSIEKAKSVRLSSSLSALARQQQQQQQFTLGSAAQKLGFQPRVSLAEGMERTLAYFQDQRNKQ